VPPVAPQQVPTSDGCSQDVPAQYDPIQDDPTRYLQDFLAEIDRQLPRLKNFRRQESEDFRSYMCLWLMERPHLMNDYHPRALVATSIRQRSIDFYRSMTRQLPQGRFDSEVGSLPKPLVWLDSIGDESGSDPAMVTPSSESEVVNSMMLGALLTSLSPRQQQVFVLVDLKGHTVVQAARAMGVRREWAQRALGQARHCVRSRSANY
jgi:RNA polymerase sigma factor (sigma-70 family)